MLLEQEGYAVITASDFEDAYKALQAQRFDLVTLDVRLEDKHLFNVQGLKLLQLIKEQQTDTKVIILTAYPESIREDFLEEQRADALILKVPPKSYFDTNDFLQMVSTLLSPLSGDVNS
jgi:DNA-binding response OmpR family regulator